MQFIKKAISSLLIILVLFSTTGIQGAIHHCIKGHHDDHIAFFNNDLKESCCHEDTHDICSPSDQHYPYNNESFSSTECCIQSNFYYQLNVNTSAFEHKQSITNIFDFDAITINFPKFKFDIIYKSYLFTPPFIGFNLENGERIPILFSQFLI